MFKNSEEFPFLKSLEENWQMVRQELEQLQQRNFLPWPEKHLYGKGWEIFCLYAYSMKLYENCKLCPETTRLIESIPGMIIAGFSALEPNTYIAPHSGYPDGVLRCHLGLTGCEGCGIRVGEETRHWQEGKCLVFDDTTEHEVWHRGTQKRVVLLFDFRYPIEKNWVSQKSPSDFNFLQNIFKKLTLK